MSDSVIRGNPITREARYDLDGVLTDPALPLITIRNPIGVAVVTNATPTRIGAGIYQYVFPVALDAPDGNWQDEWTGVLAGQSVGPIIGYFTVLPVGSIAPVPSSTYTYNLATDVGKVRFLIQDTDMSSVSTNLPLEQRSATFTDEEIAYMVADQGGDLYETASVLLLVWATNKQLIVIARRTSRTSVDYGAIRADLMALSKAYHDQSITSPADGYAEQSWTDFSFRQILDNEMLRDTA